MEKNIIDYIQKNLPKIVFNPIKFPNYGKTNALGFVITDDKMVIGYIKKDGTLCKIMNPINLSTLTNDSLIEILQKIPVVSGFNEKDKENLLKLFDKTTNYHVKNNDIEKLLKQYINDPSKNEYIVKYDGLSQDYITIKKQYENIVIELEKQVMYQQKCHEGILQEKQVVINKIQEYKQQVNNFLNDKTVDIKNIKQKIQLLVNKLNQDQITINNIMKNMAQQNPELSNTILELQNELNVLKQELNTKSLEVQTLKEYKNTCSRKIIEDKEVLVDAIKEYKEKWMKWLNNTNMEHKVLIEKIKQEYTQTNEKFNQILQDNNLKESEIKKLKDSLNTLRSTIDLTTNEQLVAINAKYADEIDQYKMEIERQRQEILQLNNDLNKVKSLLQKNVENKIPLNVNYDDCKKIAYIFRKVNNQIMRKKEIIQIIKDKIIPRLKSIATENINFEELAPNIIPIYTLNTIENEIKDIEYRLNQHTTFFDLEKYNIESKILQLENPEVKSSSELQEFCNRLNDINLYWSANEQIFFQDDIQLTNIYEDLSGSIRVYVRIRPNEENTIRAIDQFSLEVDCPNPQSKQVFTNFFGVFDQSFTNKDIYLGYKDNSSSGFENLQISNIDTLPNNIGLYHSLKQVENGYSSIVFGYGLSGSGKTRTLFGESSENTPGLIHYALANLNNVQSISIKNIFEHYISKQNLQEGYLSGKIINLLGKIPPVYNGSKTVTIPQTFEDQELNLEEFREISLTDLPEQLEEVTSILEQHRINKKRIKETPNNLVSSRSHLFMVFKIYFTTGKTGYLTFVDMAGRESPIDIYQTFFDPRSYSLASFMLYGKNLKQIPILQSKINEEYINYDVPYVHNLLEESFFVNESINHLMYFFQKKNNKKGDFKKQLPGLDSYSLSRFYVSPRQEEMGNIDISKNCLMIPILEYLDNQGKSQDEFKPTKFIMICNVRQEPRYCKQIIETLNFANSIKST